MNGLTHPLDPDAEHPPAFLVDRGRTRVGLRRCDERQWLHLDEALTTELQLRTAILDDPARAPSLVCEPAGVAAAEELAASVAAWLRRHGPSGLVARDRHGQGVDGVGSQLAGRGGEGGLGRGRSEPPGVDALDSIARSIQEDVCVLEPDELRMVAAAVCVPFEWSPSEHLGRTLGGVHARVPHYQPVAAAAERTIRSMEGIRWRANWFLVASGELRLHPDEWAPGDDAGWLRIERQTLRRLPETGAIVFTIRTYLTSLDVIAADPRLASALGTAVRALTPERLEYHAMASTVLERVAEW